MSERATGLGVVEGDHLQKRLKTRRTTLVTLGVSVEDGLFIGGWQLRSHRRRLIGNSVPKRPAFFSPNMLNLLGSVSHE
jgi:hypothetical protein